jgi:ribosomal protein S18 acetylase RimI-like enzyme
MSAARFPGGPETVRIRRAAAGDRERMAAILIGTGRFTERETTWALELVDAALSPGGSEYEAVVLEDGAATVQGWALFGPTPRSEGVYDLYWIAVERDQQRRGYGRALLHHVEEDVLSRNGRMLLIETSSKETYAPTVRFYEQAGYREISRIKDFYRIEDDKLVFSRNLTPP